MTTPTPMLQQYHELKRQHPGTLLFFRLGDFYELFYDDAVTGARELQITLTARHKERGAPIPMCGVPHHAAANHIARLIRKGYRVAICEQTEDPSKTKKLMRREVVRVITPGTAIDPQLIEANESVYLAAVCATGERMGLAFLDLSTGEFRATEASGPNAWNRIRADIESYEPRELLFPASLTPLIKDLFDGTKGHATRLPLPYGQSKDVRSSQADASQADTPPSPSSASDNQPAVGSLTGPIALTPLDDWLWQSAECASLLCAQFGARSLEGYNLDAKTEAVRAAGACLYYARDTQRAAVAHITDITYFEAQDSLVLDHTTVRNLELTEAQTSANRAHSLFGVINTTVTGMGARLLRAWLLRPSMRRGEIEARLAAVDDLYQSQIRRDALRRSLREITDLERLMGRINMATATPRDLAALRRSLEHIPATHQALSDADSSLLQILRENTDEMPDVQKRISEAISDDPPSQISDGGSVRDGYSAELDELRQISRDAKQIIASFEARERTRSGIASLRIRFNNISGYFIEVPKASAGRVPPTYERRQTIANAERFTTTELRELERRVLGAETRMAELETSIVAEVRTAVGVETKRLQATARALATLDALAALAETAVRRRYVRPVLHDGDDLEIREARHPVIEALSTEQFVPNDLYMNNSTDRLLIITGPNMGGKCLSSNTLLYTDRGLLKIADLMPAGAREGEFAEVHCQVQSKDGRSQATHFYMGGKQATIKVTTRFGYQIEGTPEHRVWVRRADESEGWKRLEELSVSDTVALDRQVDLWGQQTEINCEQAESLRNVKRYRLPTELDEDLGYMMGLLIGDGTLTIPSCFMLTTADDFIANEYRRIINKHFGCHVGYQATHLCHRVSSKQIRVFLESLGLGYGRAHEKYVPHSILRAPKQIVIAFLQGLFDTDGWAANRQVKVYLATSSVRLAREVQMLLLNLGIVASLRVKQTRFKPCHLISIYGADAIKFHERVGFRLPRKQVRQNLASNLRMPNIGIPHLAGTLKGVQQRIVTTAQKPLALKHNKSVNSIFYTYIPTHRNISYGKLDELIAYCRQNSVACPELEDMQKRHYFYDTVARVESGEADVYDLNVASDHSYIANGFVSHNSTILRQTALIVILAQMGSFVPATRARLPVLDRIWTRVGASDDLAHGRSTFMVEMTETAAILHNASPRSLVLLDEIGRGTSTFDGLSIAWAVAEHLHDSPQHAAKTLFATHYHELTELAERLPGAQNYRIAVAEQDDAVIFLYRLERGRASKSYGIEVARLAGLPPQVIGRARDVLARLERYELDVFAEATPDAETEIGSEATAERPGQESHNGDDALSRASRRAGRRALAAQATLFDAVNQTLLDELRGIDVETFSADDARQLLLNIRNRII